MAVNLSPIWGAGAQLLDNSGNVLSGGKIYTYAAGTTTQVTTFTDNSGVTANSNPIVLNSAGRVPYEIWLTDGQNYKFVLKDSNDVLIGTWDNLSGINSNFVNYTNEQEIQTATAGQTVFNLTTMQYLPGSGNLSVFVDGVNQYGPGAQYAFIETDPSTVTFASGLHVGASVKFTSTQIQNAGVTDASQVTYTYPDSNAVTQNVEERLAQFALLTDFGAVCDGVTDDTSAVQDAITAFGSDSITLIVPGATLISSSVTFGSNTVLQFQNGGKFVGDAGTEVVTLQKQPIAPLVPIFENCASVATTGMTVYPEWFGAVKNGSTDDLEAFNNAVSFLQNVGGVIQLQSGYYAISDELSIGYNHIIIQGAGNNVSWIKVTGTNKNGIKINGVAGTPIRNIMLRDFSIILATAATGTSFGLNLYYCAFPIVERMQIHDFLYGLRMEGATNSQITKVGATYTGATNGFIGFPIYGGASGAGAANASSILKDCYASGVSGLTGQIGFKVYGSYMSDVQFDTCETALTNYGYNIDYSAAPNFNVDIIIRNPIVDRYFTQGILVNQLPSNGCLQIIGGYSNPDTLGSAAQNMYFYQCIGAVTVVGHEFMALTNTIYTDGVYMTGCNGITVSSCVFTQLNRGVYATNTGYSVITANVFRGGNPSSFSKMIEIVQGSRVMVNGNSFSGATEAVNIDATSSGCGIVGNTANISTVATRYTNAGSGPIGGADGSTGLNSGV